MPVSGSFQAADYAPMLGGCCAPTPRGQRLRHAETLLDPALHVRTSSLCLFLSGIPYNKPLSTRRALFPSSVAALEDYEPQAANLRLVQVTWEPHLWQVSAAGAVSWD